MSRLFDDSSTEYLQVESAVVSAYPIGMACKFRSNDDTARQTFIWVGDKDVADHFCSLDIAGDIEGKPVRARQKQYDVGGEEQAETTSGFTVDTWHHAAAMFLNNSERHAYIDGENKGSDTGIVGEIHDHDRTAIGACRDSSVERFMSGDIAEAAIWDLTDWGANDAERETNFEKAIASLAKGATPDTFPLGLLAYWDLVRGLNDRVGGFNMTASGTVVSPHPSIILPTKAWSPCIGIDATVELVTQSLALTQHAVVISIDVTVLPVTLQLVATLLTPEVGAFYPTIPPFMLKDLIDPYSGGAWLWLVEIAIPGYDIVRIAKNTEDIIYGSVLFPKGNFDPGKQFFASDASIPRVQLRVAQDGTHVLEDIVNASKGGENGTVKLIRTCEKFLDIPVDALEADYDILTAGSDPIWVMFILGIPNPLLQRIPLWAYSSKVCPLATPSLFKGPRCQYTGNDTVCTGLLEDCYAKGNAAHWGAEIGLDPNAVRV